jgi:hypothetical protein
MWTATGLFAAGATATGVLALGASNDLATLRKSDTATRAALDAAQNRTRTLAAVTDGLVATAVVSAGLALYVSLRGEAGSRGAVGLLVTTRGVSAEVSF